MAKRSRRSTEFQTRPRTPYAELGLPDNAPLSEVRRAYRELVKQLHPDSGGPEADQVRLDRVVEAYRSLTAGESSTKRPARESPREVSELDRMMNLARSGRTPSLRLLGVKGLRRIGGPAAVRCLADVVLDKDARVGEKAIEALVEMSPERAAAAFGGLYRRAEADRRVVMIEALGGLGDPTVIIDVVLLGLTDESSVVRRAALHRYAEIVR